MRRETYNEDGDRELVWVLGWGNKPEYENVQWLIEQLIDADYRMNVFEIPTVVTDWEAEWVDPVREFTRDLEEYRLLGHSTGGLIGEHLHEPEPVTRTYLSPWWGFHEDWENPITSMMMSLPISMSIFPASFEKEVLGDLATDRQVEETPSLIAPTFLREARRAQRALPAFREGTVVFYTQSDEVVGVEAIEERTPEDNRVRYEGGHELFCSSSREEHLDTLLAAIDGGVDAIGED